MSEVAVDLTINVPALITLAVLAGGGVAAWVTVRMQVAANKAALAEMNKELAVTNERLETASRRIEEVRAKGAKELADFKLEVAQRYATGDLIKEVEERLIEAINRLGDRFDRYVDGQPARRRTARPQ